MCLAIPLKIIKQTEDGSWVMEDGRVVKKVMRGKVKKGDYLVCQQDMGVERLPKSQALKMRQALKGAYDEISKRN